MVTQVLSGFGLSSIKLIAIQGRLVYGSSPVALYVRDEVDMWLDVLDQMGEELARQSRWHVNGFLDMLVAFTKLKCLKNDNKKMIWVHTRTVDAKWMTFAVG